MKAESGRVATVFGLASLLALGAAASADDARGAPSHGLQVRLSGGRLTVNVESAALSDVLSEIARLTGVDIRLGGTGSHVVSASFTDVPLDEAIRRLTQGVPGVVVEFEETGDDQLKLLGASVMTDGVQGTGHVQSGRAPGGRVPLGAAAVTAAVPPAPVPLPAPEEQLRTGAPEDILMGASRLYPGLRGADAVYAAASHADPQIRANALTTLVEVGSGDRLRQALEEAAKDPDPTVAQLASRMLGRATPGPDESPRSPRRR